MAAPEFVVRAIKRALWRVGIWVVVLLLIFAVSEWIHTAYWPTQTTSIAVDQMQDSDAAFIQMQTHEQAKNSLSTITILLAVLWTVVVWLDYAVRSGFAVKKFIEEEVV